MALVSMKTKDEMPSVSSNSYGYGTCLYLTDDQCEALGIKTAPPAGTMFMISAVAVAKSVTQSVEEAGEGEDKPDVKMELQITEMELKPATGRKKSEMAAALYGEDD